MASTSSVGASLDLGGVLRRAVGVVTDDLRILGVVVVGGLLSVVPLLGSLLSIAVNAFAVRMAGETLDSWNAAGPEMGMRILYGVIGSVVAGILVGIGFILLVVPGVYAALKFFLVLPAAVLDGEGPLQALSESWDRTAGHLGLIFGFQVVVFLLPLVVLLAAVFGLASGSPTAAAESLQSIGAQATIAIVFAPVSAVGLAGMTVMYAAFGAAPETGTGTALS